MFEVPFIPKKKSDDNNAVDKDSIGKSVKSRIDEIKADLERERQRLQELAESELED